MGAIAKAAKGTTVEACIKGELVVVNDVKNRLDALSAAVTGLDVLPKGSWMRRLGLLVLGGYCSVVGL